MDKISVANLVAKNESEIVCDGIMSIRSIRGNKKTIKMEVEDIIKTKKERRENKLRLYRENLKDCIRIIKTKDEMRFTDMVFDINKIEYGHPEYDCEECVDYVIIELRNFGFDVKKMKNSETSIFVSWKYLELHNRD